MKTAEAKTNSKAAHSSSPLVRTNPKESDFFGQSSKEDTNFFGPKIIQPKLQIGRPGDKYEQEADAVADKVMRMPDTKVQRQPKEEEEEKLQMKPKIQLKANGNNVASPAIASQLQSSKGNGQSLSKKTQAELGSKMGNDFSGVNIHTDSKATQMNRQLGARAFTHGSDIYFNEGEYTPESSKGKHLLAHELTHVVQQKDLVKTFASPLREGEVKHQKISLNYSQVGEKTIRCFLPDNIIGYSNRDAERDNERQKIRKTGKRSEGKKSEDNKYEIKKDLIFEGDKCYIKPSKNSIFLNNLPPRIYLGPSINSLDKKDNSDKFKPYETEMGIVDACNSSAAEMENMLARYGQDSRYKADLWEAYEGLLLLGKEMSRDRQNRESIEVAWDRYDDLVSISNRIQFQIKSDKMANNRRKVLRDLQHAREEVKKIQVRLTFAYRAAIIAGQDPEDFDLTGSDKSLLFSADLVLGLLNAINEVDAKIENRNVASSIDKLNKAWAVMKVFKGWKPVGSFMPQMSADINALNNVFSATTGTLSLVGLDKYLPFLGHISLCLGYIQKKIGPINSKLQKTNRISWAMDWGLWYPNSEIGGKMVWGYLKEVFRARNPYTIPSPPETVVKFFDDNRDMFDTAAHAIMGQDKIPTESSWLLFETADPYQLNKWVFNNRKMIWRLVYGPNLKMPKHTALLSH